MIDLKRELTRSLTMAEVCTIEDFAIQSANDHGFLNRYVFERALLVFAAVVIYPDRKDEINNMIGQEYDIRVVFDALVKDGTLENMYKTHAADINYLFEVGEQWFLDVSAYEHSVRGLLDSISDLSGDILSEAVAKLQQVAKGDVQYINDFAEKWGIDNNATAPALALGA